MAITPTVESVNDLRTEEEELLFAKAFRELMRLKNILSTFTNFEFEDIYIEEQEFADYTSKYLDLYDKIKTDTQKENVSILDEIDFELELIHRDEVNVTYILKLLAELRSAPVKDQPKKEKEIIDMVAGETELRSKKELIQKFILNNLPALENDEDVEEEFNRFWKEETKKAMSELTLKESLDQDKVEEIINDYLFTGRMATEDEVIDALEKQPSVLQRESISTRITNKIQDFISTFISGV